MRRRWLVASVPALSLATFTTAASAQDATPKGVLKTDQASSGKTDAATSGFEAAAKKEAESKDATEAKLSAGGLATAGNSRSLALTTSGNYRIRRESEQFSVVIAGNYAQAGKGSAPVTESVENIQGKLRYDHFFIGSFAGFLGVSARRDRFQGLDLRLNIDPGVAYYFIDEKKHQLWGELGYDLQFDMRRQEFVDAAAAAGTPVDKNATQHGARAFVGYSNKLSDQVQFTTNLEYIQSLQDTNRFRINWDGGITSSIAGNLSIATTLLLQYDNAPLPAVKETDFTTSVSLVYKLL